MERAEEIIAEVYRQLTEARSRGRRPKRILMSASLWNQVEEYRQSLGIIDGPHPDYLSEEGIFGLEIWYSNNSGIVVE